VKKSVLWAACGVAAVAVGFVVVRRVRSTVSAPIGASLDDCVGQPARYTRILKPRLRLRFPRRPRD
jgi:hypothetical protein